MATSKDDVKDFLKNMPVHELLGFVKELEDEWGVSASAPAAVAVAPVGGGDDGGDEAPTEVSVILSSIGDKKIQVIKAVREITGLGLKEAKEVVDNAPKAVKEGIAPEEAEKIKTQLEEAGATAEVK